jgi:hypothetical protein
VEVDAFGEAFERNWAMSWMGIAKKLRRLAPLSYVTARPSTELDIGRKITLSPGYFPTNPSFVDTDLGRLVCIRGVNYRLADDLSVTPIFTVGDRYHSVNRFVLLDGHEVVRALPELDAAFEGAEDVRLFAFDGALWGACSRPTSGVGLNCEMLLMKINDDYRGAQAISLASPYGFRREKNWLPFVHEEVVHFIYSFEPLVVLRCDPRSGRLEFVDPQWAQYSSSLFTFLMGGSASGVRAGNRQLFIVHRRSVRLPRLRRIYVHRCATLDPSLRALSFGPYFVVGGAEIQFVAGMGLSNEVVRLSYGRMDRFAFLAEFDRRHFLATFVPHAGD